MANIKPETLDWLDNLAKLNIQLEMTPKASHANLAKALGLKRTTVTYLSALRPIFNQEAVNKIRLAAQANPPYILSFNNALALSRLNGRVGDLPGAVLIALEQVISRRLAKLQTKALVAWMAGGKPVGEFDPAKVKRRSTVRSLQSTGKETSSQETQSPKPEVATSPNAPIPSKTLGDKFGSPPRNDSKVKQSKTPVMGTAESLFWGQLAGVSLVSRIRSKIKKEERPTLGESLILVGGDALGRFKVPWPLGLEDFALGGEESLPFVL